MKAKRLTACFAILSSMLVVASCGSGGTVGTYECPYGSRTKQLELTSNGKAVWTFPSRIRDTMRYEEKDGEIRLFLVAGQDPGETDALQKWRHQATMNHPQRRFVLEEGNLRDLDNARESCTRA